jgi:hypothetical protein
VRTLKAQQKNATSTLRTEKITYIIPEMEFMEIKIFLEDVLERQRKLVRR